MISKKDAQINQDKENNAKIFGEKNQEITELTKKMEKK